MPVKTSVGKNGKKYYSYKGQRITAEKAKKIRKRSTRKRPRIPAKRTNTPQNIKSNKRSKKQDKTFDGLENETSMFSNMELKSHPFVMMHANLLSEIRSNGKCSPLGLMTPELERNTFTLTPFSSIQDNSSVVQYKTKVLPADSVLFFGTTASLADGFVPNVPTTFGDFNYAISSAFCDQNGCLEYGKIATFVTTKPIVLLNVSLPETLAYLRDSGKFIEGTTDVSSMLFGPGRMIHGVDVRSLSTNFSIKLAAMNIGVDGFIYAPQQNAEIYKDGSLEKKHLFVMAHGITSLGNAPMMHNHIGLLAPNTVLQRLPIEWRAFRHQNGTIELIRTVNGLVVDNQHFQFNTIGNSPKLSDLYHYVPSGNKTSDRFLYQHPYSNILGEDIFKLVAESSYVK